MALANARERTGQCVDVTVLRVRCLGNCNRGLSAAIRGENAGLTYLVTWTRSATAYLIAGTVVRRVNRWLMHGVVARSLKRDSLRAFPVSFAVSPQT